MTSEQAWQGRPIDRVAARTAQHRTPSTREPRDLALRNPWSINCRPHYRTGLQHPLASAARAPPKPVEKSRWAEHWGSYRCDTYITINPKKAKSNFYQKRSSWTSQSIVDRPVQGEFQGGYTGRSSLGTANEDVSMCVGSVGDLWQSITESSPFHLDPSVFVDSRT